MYNSQAPLSGGASMSGLHIRGPQLNPQREPRWGRNDNSPGEDAYLEGQYGVYMIRGGQGANLDGVYEGERRKVLMHPNIQLGVLDLWLVDRRPYWK